MNYLDNETAKLGFGLMRLPRIDGDIDIEQVKEMVDLFLERGFVYFDTAYGYEGSEDAIKRALVDRYPRSSYLLATKLPAWNAPSKKDAEKMFYTSLERTQAGYFDYYLLHNLGAHRTAYFDEYGIWDFLSKRKEEGLIKHLGFSMHDKATLLKRILAEHPEMEFVQLQLNYADWENPRVEARLCYEVAREHNIPIIAMEPVKGGDLTILPPKAVELFTHADQEASLASWAIRFTASLKGVPVVLSGMSNLEQMRDNLNFMANLRPLDASEMAVIEQVRTEIDKVPTVPCTACDYCLPECPQTINIPGIFEALNKYLRYHNAGTARFTYRWNTDGHKMGRASQCSECGSCEEVCTQQIDIIDELKRARELLEDPA
jgi:predicted aldo/keto reductase-like oxidoreductase